MNKNNYSYGNHADAKHDVNVAFILGWGSVSTRQDNPEVQKRHQTFDTLNQKLYLCRKNEHYLFFLFLMVLTIFY